MRIYKNTVIVMGVLTIISFMLAFFLSGSEKFVFWCNVLLGVFGSSFITLVSAIIGYLVERRYIMQDFYDRTIKIVNYLNKYQDAKSLDEKIAFYILFLDTDMVDFNSAFSKMSFFKSANQKYIHKNIYEPIVDFRKRIRTHEMHFRWHLDGTGRNNAVMLDFVKELESGFVEEKERIINYNGDEKRMPYIERVLTEKILSELQRKYSDIMCFGRKRQ